MLQELVLLVNKFMYLTLYNLHLNKIKNLRPKIIFVRCYDKKNLKRARRMQLFGTTKGQNHFDFWF